jgi:uncharacterized protein YqjF (DUF2071 family)
MSDTEDDGADAALAVIEHRPWPLPDRPWIMYQRWERLLFAHWPVDVAELRAHVPPSLVIDLYQGAAWLSIASFALEGLRGRGLPPVPGTSSFPEFNVRTYVRYGDKPGVWFFSLDAGSLLAVGGARIAYALPYHHARTSIERQGEWIHYVCERDEQAQFEARYRPTGDVFIADRGSLDEFLVERYALYAARTANRIERTDIQHPPWRLRSAQAEIARNTMVSAAGITLPARAPLLHYSERQDVVAWAPASP